MRIAAFIPQINTQPTQNRQTINNRYSQLAPLKCDTVSFGATKKDIDEESLTDGINLHTAKKIYKDATVAQNYLIKQLDKTLGDLVRPSEGKGSQSNPIEIIRYRLKEPKSIIDKSKSLKLRTIKEVKENITDIAGARIVMADSSVKNVDKVIDRLTDAVNKDQLKILEIENYRPDPELDDYGQPIKTFDYASAKAIQRLKQAAENKGIEFRKKDEDLPSGYMAIHMLVQLPNGFKGEIQLMGGDVERFKEVEDCCYKIKGNKHLDDKYDSVEKMLEPLRDKNDTILRRAYATYTREAYIYQREKEPMKGSKYVETEFLHIPEELDYIPESLDFNNIYDEIQRCKKKNYNGNRGKKRAV